MCRHTHITIGELGTWVTTHQFENGEWSHCHNPESYSSSLWVRCADCGFEKDYPKSRRPKWLQRRFDEALGPK
jgi:hypothetical protein